MLGTDVSGFLNFKRPFILATDASTTGLGACLSQEIDGVLKPVGFTGRALNSVERNDTTTEQECLAVVLNQFTYTVKHVPGSKNVVPDAISH